MFLSAGGISPLLALAIVAPGNDAVVPTLKEAQKAYLSAPYAERCVRMDNPSDRNKLLAVGASQRPLRLAWTGETNAVYLVSVEREGGEAQVFSVSNRTDAFLVNLEIASRFSWSVREAGTTNSACAAFSTEPDAPRFLRAGGVSNFRDLGGWRAGVRQCVRQGMIFRSAGLRSSSKSKGGFLLGKTTLGDRRVTDEGLATLRDEFRIKTDLELRTPQETAGMNDSLLGGDVRWERISFAAYDFIDNVVRGREPFAKIFSLFARRENYPILMHCSGGRDRTGTLAFLLNGLLGVSEDDLCRDWEATVFSDPGVEKFNSGRLKRLLGYLRRMPGKTLQERIESYAKGCGVTDEEIASFREIMLQGVE